MPHNVREDAAPPARVTDLPERKFYMLKKDMLRRNPLRLMGYEEEDILAPGAFGALMARAGVGKTAFLVQLALDKMMRERNVLHVTMGVPVEKVCLWYEEVFRNMAGQAGAGQLDPYWDDILPKRFLMTFKADVFSAARLEERITDLTEQGIFYPQLLLVDGLNFTDAGRSALEEVKQLAETHRLAVWFTVRTHRHEEPGEDGMPVQMQGVTDLFDVAIELRPNGKDIHVRARKGGPEKTTAVVLDPSTMLVKNL